MSDPERVQIQEDGAVYVNRLCQDAVDVLCAEIERLRGELAQSRAELEAWFPGVPA